MLRTVGLGLITGAAADDPSAVGTYAAAGASLGPALLWTAPGTFPMMVAVVYLSSKIGQVSGKGLFEVMHEVYPAWVVRLALTGVLIGNVVEAGADIGGMAAALRMFVHVPLPLVVVPLTALILVLQIWGSYTLIRNVFRWLALALLGYVAAAFLAHPDLRAILSATLVPHVPFNREGLSMLVAVMGTTLSVYLYSWQSNEEVEEEIALGRRRLTDRQGATPEELRRTRWDVALGMLFSNVVMYFIILATASTLYAAGRHDISTAAEAAQARRPLAGPAAGVLFAVGIIAVGFMSVPIMTAGAAYDACQTLNWKSGLHMSPSEGRRFYILIALFTTVAMAMNFAGLNPMRALVWAGIVQGVSIPPMMVVLMRLTNRRDVMGKSANGVGANVLGWSTTAAASAAAACLIGTWIW